jgi:hypothetical protein
MVTNFRVPVRQIVELLVTGRYDQIAKITNEQRLDAESIKKAISDYGRKLIMPPSEAYEHLDVIQVHNALPPRWSVRVNLWTAEEGRSDLSLELTLVQTGEDFAIEVDDIHVL